jgi:peptidoglycan/xylan/chitin deacetylase (PgdA/CDA1 family)
VTPPVPRSVSRRTALLAASSAAALAACSDTSSSPTATPDSHATDTHATLPPAQPSPSTATTAPPKPPTDVVLHTRGPDVEAGDRGVSQVALTFHGQGTIENLHNMLGILARRQTLVTIFGVGTWLAVSPEIGKAIVGAGHDLGNHTWSHQAMRELSEAAAHEEVRRGAEQVAATLGRPGPLFRPSGTQTSTPTIRTAANESGYARCVSYDLDSLDWTDPGPDAVVANVAAGMRNGSIISLHLGHSGTVLAMPRILDLLAQRDMQAVTVTDLLATGHPVTVTA